MNSKAAAPHDLTSSAPRVPAGTLPVQDIGSLAPLIFFALLIVCFGIAAPSVFLSKGNFTSILNDGAVLAILACGLTVVLIVGEFDLSIAAAASFGGALAAVLVAQNNWALGPTILAILGSGIVIGLVNGVLVTRFEMPALIATIGVASILDGLTLWITGNSVIFTNFSPALLLSGSWSIGDIQAPVFYLLVVGVVSAVALKYSVTGRWLYATGGNRAASRMAGIPIQRQIILAFIVADVLGVLAGYVYTARQGSLTPQFGTSLLLPTFAAAFLGSVTLSRRNFHIVGTLIGVYLIETGTVGLLILGAPAYTQQLFAGAVLVLATIGARYRGARRS